MNSLEPTYFIKHPDGSYSEAEPQPKRYFYENIKVSYLINHLTSAGIHAQRASEIPSVEAVDFYMQSVNALRQQQAEIEALKANLEHAHGLGESSGFIKDHKAATAKTLTDEEILEVIKKFDEEDKSYYFSEGMGFFEIKDFVLAILRKANEK